MSAHKRSGRLIEPDNDVPRLTRARDEAPSCHTLDMAAADSGQRAATARAQHSNHDDPPASTSTDLPGAASNGS